MNNTEIKFTGLIISIVVTACVIVASVYVKILEDGMPMGALYGIIALLSLSVVGLFMMISGNSKMGFGFIIAGSALFIPLGIWPIIMARKIRDTEKAIQFSAELER